MVKRNKVKATEAEYVVDLETFTDMPSELEETNQPEPVEAEVPEPAKYREVMWEGSKLYICEVCGFDSFDRERVMEHCAQVHVPRPVDPPSTRLPERNRRARSR